MKSIVALFATFFALTAFAAEPAKKEEKKAEAKPAAAAPAAPARQLTRRQLTLLKATQKKPSLLRSNPHRVYVLTADDTEVELVFDDAIHRGYSRPKIEEFDDGELSDYVKFRLWLARQLALAKYQEKWGN